MSHNMSPGVEKEKKSGKKVLLIIGIILAVCILAAAAVFIIYKINKDKKAAADPANGVMVNGVDITGMDREAAKKKIEKSYKWNVTITYEDNTYEVEDYISEDITSILDEIYNGEAKKEYKLEVLDPDTKITEIIETVGKEWNDEPVNSDMTGYDSATGKFTFSEGKDGYTVDEEKLSTALKECFLGDNFDMAIEAEGKVTEAEYKEEDYVVMAEFVTNTTANSNRNTNVSLACESVCGTILNPGDQFSYNDVVGRRTAEKGYKPAGAYANGEHVEEIGGGVCQLSSTMYNAAINAGLQVDARTGHSYEPSYVTPGEDATVSYSKPDFKFTNSSSAKIGIKVTFKDRVVTVTIYGIPVLEEGVTQYMDSKKISTIPPEIEYVEDPTLEPGTEEVMENGSSGSVWETHLVQEKDGKVISDEYMHRTRYKTTKKVIRRNSEAPTEAPVTEAPATTPATEATTVAPTVAPTEATTAAPATESTTTAPVVTP